MKEVKKGKKFLGNTIFRLESNRVKSLKPVERVCYIIGVFVVTCFVSAMALFLAFGLLMLMGRGIFLALDWAELHPVKTSYILLLTCVPATAYLLYSLNKVKVDEDDE